MDAQTLLRSLQDRGVSVTTDGDVLKIAPRSAATPELKAAVQSCKAELIRLLQPENYDNPRPRLRHLEKALNVQGSEPEGFVLIVNCCGQPGDHPHSKAEIAAAQRRLAAQWAATSDGFHLDTMFVGCDGCHVCRLLGTEP